MKVNELNGTHIGQQFKLTHRGATVIDTLIGIEHEAEIVYDKIMGQDEPERAPGRKRTGLTFLQSGRYGTVNPDKIDVEMVSPPAIETIVTLPPQEGMTTKPKTITVQGGHWNA